MIILGTPLAAWLAQKRTSHVIARFDSTLQLDADDGQWWAITVRANPGAFRAVVPTLPDWDVGQKGMLSYKTCALWDPRPHRRVLTILEKQSATRALAEQLDETRFSETHGAWEIVAKHWDMLARALRECDEASLQKTMARLIGCGMGLTPTGDDFVQALLVTLQSGNVNDRVAFAALSNAVVSLLDRTTRTSRAFLDEALHGWAFGALKDLLDALPNASTGQVDALLKVGATSGAASALGVLMGLSYEFD